MFESHGGILPPGFFPRQLEFATASRLFVEGSRSELKIFGNQRDCLFIELVQLGTKRPMNYCDLVRWLRKACVAGVLLVIGLMSEVQACATQVWNGPLIAFTLPAGADWTQATNQDRITADVWLTRATTGGLLNAAGESGYTSFFSPANTGWSFGLLPNYASLTYTNWEGWNHHNPPSMVGQDAVLHLIPDDIYLSIKFTSWGGASGGFSYTRSTAPTVPEPSIAAMALMGLAVLLVTHSGRVGVKTKRGRSGGKTGNEFWTKQK
jgi:hypothetical protein